MVGKQDGAGCDRAVGVPEEDAVEKQDGAVRIGSRSGVPTQKVANKRRVINCDWMKVAEKRRGSYQD